MNTTNLFAEIMVIGIHFICWIGFFYAAAMGYDSISIDRIFSINFAVPVLALSYILGILMDRFSDLVFRKYENVIRESLKMADSPSAAFIDMRFYILAKSPNLYMQLEYSRSRMRVARASFVNFIFTTISVIIFIQVAPDFNSWQEAKKLSWCLVLFSSGAAFSFLSFYSYKALLNTYYNSSIRAYLIINSKDRD